MFRNFLDALLGGGNDQQADDIRENEIREEERRRREYEAELEAQKKYQAERADIRRDEREREDARARRQMEREKELREERRREKEAAERRQQELERELFERQQQRELAENEAFLEQRNFNQAEIRERTSEHKEAMTRKENQIAETEAKNNERVIKLNKERKLENEKLHNDTNVHHQQNEAATTRNNLEIQNQFERNLTIRGQIADNEEQHGRRMLAVENTFKTAIINQGVAGKMDSTEDNFIDSVNNARKCGLDAVKAVEALGKYANRLQTGERASKEDLELINVSIDRRVEMMLHTFSGSIETILSQQETKNPEVGNCQKIARDIQEAVTNLNNSVSAFSGSLSVNPIRDSPELFKTVQKDSKTLGSLISSFPYISKTNYATGVILESTRMLTGNAGNLYLAQSGSVCLAVEKEQQTGSSTQ